MAPPPGGEADHVRDKARKDLLHLLEGVRGKKNLVISRDLAGTVGLFVKFSTLQEHGVDKVFLLENRNTDSSQRNIVYLIRGESLPKVQATAAQIKKLQDSSSIEHEFSVIWAPRRTLVSNQVLEEEGILGDVNVFELPVYFLQLEQDVLSLELEDAFSDLYLRRDPTCLFLASKALMLIQKRHGFFPRILGKGDYARQLANLLLRQRKELDADESSNSDRSILPSASIESLIIIDRDVDFATPLLTQLTYEGLIDEYFGIQNNQAEVDTTIIGPGTQGRQQSQSSKTTSPPPTAKQGLKRKIPLDSSDSLYSQLRDTNFAIVGSLLHKVARRLQTDYEARHSAQSTNELRDFVNKLPGFQQEHASLGTHTNLAKELTNITDSEFFRRSLGIQQALFQGDNPIEQHNGIEELICRDAPLSTILRLLCLESVVCGGLRARDLDLFKRHILHAYGYQHLLTLDSLEEIDLLQARSSVSALLLPFPGSSGGSSGSGSGSSEAGTKTNYSYLRKSLRLIVTEVDEQNPADIAYVYSGYAPLSVRIIQCVLQKKYLLSLTQPRQAQAAASSLSAAAAAGSAAATNFHPFDDVLKSVKGPTFSIAQKARDERAMKARQALYGFNSSGGGGGARAGAGKDGKEGKMVYVYVMFVGGVTFTEISAIRFINRQMEEKGERRRIVVCTTGVISGEKMMRGVVERGDFGK